MAIVNTALTLQDLPAPPEGKTGWPWTEQSETLPDRMPDGPDWPKISIVTPNYNYGRFLEETIRSVLLQGYPNLDYIIIDGGSTDNSVEIIKKYEQFLAYWVSENDDGQTDSINKGYTKCTGDVFAWLNSDDSYENPFCLQDIAELYLQGYQFIVGECLNVDRNDKKIKITEEFNGYAPPQTFDQYLRFWSFIPLPQPCVFMAKELTDNSFPLDTILYYGMDYQLFLRVLSQKPKSIWVKKVWVKFKYHGSNKTMRPYNNGLIELYEIASSEARKKLSFLKNIEFQVSAKDFLIIKDKIESEPNEIGSLLMTLLPRPTLVRWGLFVRLMLKALIGKEKYLLFKEKVLDALKNNH
jgi:glycosyltransferase involved in cell wall biosynthesis